MARNVDSPADVLAEELEAYNRAFLELELPWQWDASTLRGLLAAGDGDFVGSYVERHHPHLLKAYDRAFLRDLIHSTKGRRRTTAGSS